MKKSTRVAIATAAAVAAGGLVVVAAQADTRWHGKQGYQESGGKHGGRHGDSRGGLGRMSKMLETFDANGDGALTQEEIDTARLNRFTESDADGDKALMLTEYQALWLDVMHERMVDRFQKLDADGDGRVTAEEFAEPYSHFVARADHNDDGKVDKDDRQHRGRHHDDDDDDDDARRGNGEGPKRQGSAQ